MGDEIATFEIEDLFQGKEFSFEKKISSSDVNMFANLTGDNSPLHMDDGFAQERGFKGRVVHGGLLVGCISQLVGVFFPGENSVIQTLNIKFSHPAYIGDVLKICVDAPTVTRCVDEMLVGIFIIAPGRVYATLDVPNNADIVKINIICVCLFFIFSC